jgi:hypothetical protein
VEYKELDKIRGRLKQKVDKSREEPEGTMLDRLLYRLGFVRLRKYDDLVERYERLYRRYVGKRMEMDHIVKNCVIGDADTYELVQRARKAGGA